MIGEGVATGDIRGDRVPRFVAYQDCAAAGERWRAMTIGAALSAAIALLAGCSAQNEVAPYPNLSEAPPPMPDAALSPAERDAAISEMQAEARANADRGQ